VEQVSDSTRFFAIRVVHGRQKATLGIGFEDRADAFDFGVCLQEVRRRWAIDKELANKSKTGHGSTNIGGFQSIFGSSNEEGGKNDYSLKEGEMINITIGVSSG
jgi:adaptin ear-binding coat-associated protein 1/2